MWVKVEWGEGVRGEIECGGGNLTWYTASCFLPASTWPLKCSGASAPLLTPPPSPPHTHLQHCDWELR